MDASLMATRFVRRSRAGPFEYGGEHVIVFAIAVVLVWFLSGIKILEWGPEIVGYSRIVTSKLTKFTCNYSWLPFLNFRPPPSSASLLWLVWLGVEV